MPREDGWRRVLGARNLLLSMEIEVNGEKKKTKKKNKKKKKKEKK